MHIPDGALNEVLAILERAAPADCGIYAYGSRVHGRNLKPFSDLDLCLMASRPIGADEMVSLRYAFEDSDLPFRVEIVDWRRLRREFRAAIIGDLEAVVTRSEVQRDMTID
ncbi:nucleotidyltransferase domain-containing protein [Herbaspirillum sp. HC18]|nr:nucleotidyltransferase domain-containing protein [Herbaspirillum sp. HC18]